MPYLLEFIIIKCEDKAYARLYHLSQHNGLVLVLAIGADQVAAILGEFVGRVDIACQIRRSLLRRAGAYDVEAAAYVNPEPVFHELFGNVDVQFRVVDLVARAIVLLVIEVEVDIHLLDEAGGNLVHLIGQDLAGAGEGQVTHGAAATLIRS